MPNSDSSFEVEKVTDSLDQLVLFEPLGMRVNLTAATSIYIPASSKSWSNIDSGYKSHQEVNKHTVCERHFRRGKNSL